MKVTITDREAIEALSWEALKAYLDNSDWQRVKDVTGKAAAYQHPDEAGRRWEILVPLSRDLADYVSRMADAVTILARIEDRSELDVYEDLRALGAKSQPVDDATRVIHEKIRHWLAEEGWHVQDTTNSARAFDIVVGLPNGQFVRVLQLRPEFDHIVIAKQLLLSDRVQSKLMDLSSEKLADLVWSLRRDSTIVGVDMEGLELPLKAIWHLASIYFDGLTKDVLLQRIFLVLRAFSLSVQTLVRGLEQAKQSEAATELLRLVPKRATGDLLSAAS